MSSLKFYWQTTTLDMVMENGHTCHPFVHIQLIRILFQARLVLYDQGISQGIIKVELKRNMFIMHLSHLHNFIYEGEPQKKSCSLNGRAKAYAKVQMNSYKRYLECTLVQWRLSIYSLVNTCS